MYSALKTQAKHTQYRQQAPQELKIAVRSKARAKKRYIALLDFDVFEHYKSKNLKFTQSRGVYYSEGKKKRQVAREILGLTHRWQYVRFASKNKLDLRKKNLKSYVVPKSRRGSYGVQSSKLSSN
jgi:hypothetical protein